jgi:hypothetical protein
MRTMPSQFLTWGPITAAVVSAVWLSSSDQAAVFCSFGYRSTSQAMGLEPLPASSAHAGAAARRANSRKLQASDS